MPKRKKTMEKFEHENACPNCGAAKMKTWDELDFEQKIVVERLPAGADFSRAERKKHRFCVRCFFEEIEPRTRNV